MTNSEIVRAQLCAIPVVALQIRCVFEEYVRTLYDVMVTSEDLLWDAFNASEGKINAYYAKHLEEEQGHAEWLKRDMATLGIEPTKLPLDVAHLVGPVIYCVRFVNHEALLGHMFASEQGPVSEEALIALEELYGKEGLSCIRHHVMEDRQHREELSAIIDELEDISLVSTTAKWVWEGFQAILKNRCLARIANEATKSL